VGILGLLLIFSTGILNTFHYIAIFIKNGIATPLGLFSAILSVLSLLGGFLFRHEVRRVKVAICVLLFFSLAGFTFSGLIQYNNRIPKDPTPMITEFSKEKEALNRELVSLKDITRQKENTNALINQQKDKMTKEVEIQKQQLRTYAEMIQQKEKEISSLKQEKEKLGKVIQTEKQQNI